MDMLSYARIPIYIFLSGLFFSTYDSFKEFVVKKANRYIIPFCFFFIISLPLLQWYYHKLNYLEFKVFVCDILVNCNVTQLNGPLWFLLLLAWLSIISYCLEIALRKQGTAIKIATCTTISFIFFTLNSQIQQYGISCYATTIAYNLKLFHALILLPFFYLPHLFRQHILQKHSLIYMLFILPIALATIYASSHNGPINHNLHLFDDSYLWFIVGQFAGIYCIFFMGYLLKHLPYFSYVGRYSIIVLGTHMLVFRCIHFTFMHIGICTPYIMFVMLLITAPVTIWFFKKYFPHLTAQKDILKIDENGKVKISF